MSDPRVSPQAAAANTGTAFIGFGTVLTLLGMMVMQSDPLVAGGVAVLAVGLVFQARSLRLG